MGAFADLAGGFATALTPSNLLFALLGVLLGTAIGVLPGIGPATAVAMLLPITLQVEPTGSMIFFAGIYYGAMYGGSTTSILLNTPGETASMVTAMEGNKMAKSGRAGAALDEAGFPDVKIVASNDLSEFVIESVIREGEVDTANGSVKVLLMKPQTYMNESGRAVGEAARFYKIAVADVLLIHDELDLPFGRLQLKAGGGSGGHNGLKSTVQCLGEDGFIRLRLGIGKPQGPNAKERVAGYVLSNFDDGESRQLDELLAQAADAAETWVRDGLATAMNRFNKRAP